MEAGATSSCPIACCRETTASARALTLDTRADDRLLRRRADARGSRGHVAPQARWLAQPRHCSPLIGQFNDLLSRLAASFDQVEDSMPTSRVDRPGLAQRENLIGRNVADGRGSLPVLTSPSTFGGQNHDRSRPNPIAPRTRADSDYRAQGNRTGCHDPCRPRVPTRCCRFLHLEVEIVPYALNHHVKVVAPWEHRAGQRRGCESRRQIGLRPDPIPAYILAPETAAGERRVTLAKRDHQAEEAEDRHSLAAAPVQPRCSLS